MKIWLIGLNIKSSNRESYFFKFKNLFSQVAVTKVETYHLETSFCILLNYTFKQAKETRPSESVNLPSNSVEYLDGWAVCENSGKYYQNIFNPTLFGMNEKILMGGGEFAYFKLSKLEATLISDFYATCPIYYCLLDGEFLASNDLRVIISIFGRSLEISREKCIKFLSSHVSLQESEVSSTETFFKNIYKMPPHSILKYANGNLNINSHFDVLDLLKPINYKKTNYIESFRERFNKCTKNRAGNSKVAIMLSGGIDSSAILASLKDNDILKNVTAINMSFYDNELTNTHDKEIAVRLIKDYNIKGGIMWGDKLLRVPNACPGQDPLGFIDGPVPSANILAHESLSHWALKSGAEISFTGEQGDALLGEDMVSLVYDSLFKSGEYLEMFNLMIRASGKSFCKFVNNFIKNFLMNLNSFSREYFYDRSYWAHTKMPPPLYFSKDLIDYESVLKKKNLFCSHSLPFNLVAHKYIFDYYFPRASYFDVMNIYKKYSHPFIDKKLLELIFSLPTHICVDYKNYEPHQKYFFSKQLARDAYKNVLPDYARLKKIKTTYAGMARKIFLNSKNDIINLFFDHKKLMVEELGLIYGSAFKKDLAKFIMKLDDPNNTLGLQYQYIKSVVHMEIWLNCVHKIRKDSEFLKIHMPRPLADIDWINE